MSAVDLHNTICPVSTEPVANSKLVEVYNGKVYHLCCGDCRADFEKDRDRIYAESEDRQRELVDLRARFREETAKMREGVAALEAEVAMHQAAEAVFETFVGGDPASKETARGVVMLLAANPGWAGNAEGVQKVAQSIGAIIQAAVNKGVQQ